MDITDFFNFGFNEDTWKQYCSSLVNNFNYAVDVLKAIHLVSFVFPVLLLHKIIFSFLAGRT